MENENQEIIPQNEEQADSLIDSVQAPSNEPIADAKPAAPTMEEYEITVGGKAIKANRDTLIKWAQMGHDAPTRIGKLNKELQTWKQKEESYKQMDGKYGPIDAYVRENPQFWDHVVEQFQKRNQALADQNNPMASTVNQMQQKIDELFQYKQNIESERQQVVAAREDQDYMKELESIKTKYPKIDFATPDDQGKSLEYKVLEYANQNGIKKLTTAFRDFYHDELVKLHEESAKENVVKDKVRNTKLGILGITQTSSKRSNDDVRGKSYNDLAREAIEEYKLS